MIKPFVLTYHLNSSNNLDLLLKLELMILYVGPINFIRPIIPVMNFKRKLLINYLNLKNRRSVQKTPI